MKKLKFKKLVEWNPKLNIHPDAFLQEYNNYLFKENLVYRIRWARYHTAYKLIEIGSFRDLNQYKCSIANFSRIKADKRDKFIRIGKLYYHFEYIEGSENFKLKINDIYNNLFKSLNKNNKKYSKKYKKLII